jgi:hypothetical protein
MLIEDFYFNSNVNAYLNSMYYNKYFVSVYLNLNYILKPVS